MEEITMQDLDDLQQESPKQQLIQIKQLPIIVEHLRGLKSEIIQETQQAVSLACTPETIQEVKKTRTDLGKRFSELEGQRKDVKAAIMQPYEKFEEVYKECVSDPFKHADSVLKGKISAVEKGIIDDCRSEMKSYFEEMVTGYHIEWLTFDRMGLQISLTDAKQKKHQKLREAVAAFTVGVAQDVRAIQKMEWPEELLVEYKETLNLAESVEAVTKRHKQLEEARLAKERFQAAQAADQAVVDRVEAVAPPAPAPAPVPTQVPVEKPVETVEKTYKLRFAVTAKKSQLIQFKEDFIAYCEERGLKYE